MSVSSTSFDFDALDQLVINSDGDDVLLGGPGVDVLDGGAGDNVVIQDAFIV
jgi:Ca2+-binding RTX toxin-like protein